MKKILSIVLAVCMMMGILPMSIAANTQTQIPYTVLVLDVSGSMSGDPLAALKDAAINFCEKILTTKGHENHKIAVVSYASSARKTCDFTSDINTLTSAINGLDDWGVTNISDPMSLAFDMLSSVNSEARNIILMTDGIPNEGMYDGSNTKYESYRVGSTKYYGGALYDYVSTNIWPTCDVYTVGFFHDLSGSSKDFAEQLLKDLQNTRYFGSDDAQGLYDSFSSTADMIVGTATQISTPTQTESFGHASGSGQGGKKDDEDEDEIIPVFAALDKVNLRNASDELVGAVTARAENLPSPTTFDLTILDNIRTIGSEDVHAIRFASDRAVGDEAVVTATFNVESNVNGAEIIIIYENGDVSSYTAIPWTLSRGRNMKSYDLFKTNDLTAMVDEEIQLSASKATVEEVPFDENLSAKLITNKEGQKQVKMIVPLEGVSATILVSMTDTDSVPSDHIRAILD